MDLGANADGELLQRALEGDEVSEPGILELVAVLHAVQAIDQARLAPSAEFVSDLRARLLADDPPVARPAPPVGPDGPDGADGRAGPGDETAPTEAHSTPAHPTPAHPTEADPPRTGGTVSVLRVAARPLRLVAAAAAAVLVLGGALGAASRSAVPGDTLYGIKQLLDRAAVQLAGSRYDEGLTYLAQAQEHISDARDLLDGGNPATHDLDTAYDAATDATRRAQTILLEAYRTEGRTSALTELADFYARAIPQVDAMRPRVPAGSLSAWQRLRETLGAGDVATMRALASCAACGDRAVQARTALAGLAATARGGGSATSTFSPGTTAGTPARPGSTSGPGAVRTSAGPPGSTATTPGGLPLPGGSVTDAAPLPGSTVNLPTVGVHSSSVGVGGGGVTLPGATLPAPHVGVTSTKIQVVVPPPTPGVPSLSGLPSIPVTVPLTPPPTIPLLP
ncbi:hypothetical protein [Terrabacter sp. BE26]|uniref:hypothetical protein n=1 Tax=Terrabacter sp. BE26 TaxID=2898152 RepID=UPI0035BE9C5F